MESTPIYVTTIENDADLGERLKDTAKHPLHVTDEVDFGGPAGSKIVKKCRGQTVNRYNLSWILALLADLALILVSLLAEEPLVSLVIITPAVSFCALLISILVLLCHQKTAAVIFLIFAVPIIVAHLAIGTGMLVYGSGLFESEWMSDHVTKGGAVRIGAMHFLPLPFVLITTVGFLRVVAGTSAHDVGLIKPPPYFRGQPRSRVCILF